MKRSDQKFILALERLFNDQQRVQADMSKGELWSLLSAVQLACRHPRFTGPTREIVERAARQLGAVLVANDQDLRMLFEMGWNPQFDDVHK